MGINQLKAGAFLSYVLILISNIIGVVYTPFMLRMMGQSEYGLYSLTATVVGVLTILDFGFGNAIIRYIAKFRALNQKDEEYNLNGMFLIVYTAIALLVVIVGIVLYPNVGNLFSGSMNVAEVDKAKFMMIILIFNLAITFPLGIFGFIITAYENYIFSKAISIIRIIIYPCIMVPMLIIGYRAIGMIVVSTVLNIATLLINMAYCFAKLKIKLHFKKFDFDLLKEITTYSFFTFLMMIVDQINWNADKIILGAVSGTVMVAIYSVAAQLNTYYLSFSTAIASVFLPRITAMVTNNASEDEISDLFIKIGRVQYIIMAFVMSGFLLIGQEFINIWAGKDYKSAFYIAAILMLPVTAPLIQNLGIIILQAKNKQKFRTFVLTSIAGLNIALSIPLGKLYGGIGCAIGTSVALILGPVISMNIYYYKKIHINIPKFWKEILVMTIPVVIAVGISVGMNYLWKSSGYIDLLLKAIVFSVIYAPLMWFLGMNKYEKDLFRGPVLKILRKTKLIGA